jgi:hypothetical protein
MMNKSIKITLSEKEVIKSALDLSYDGVKYIENDDDIDSLKYIHECLFKKLNKVQFS